MTPHERLRQSRKEAGYANASAAADAFGWPRGTYLGHENGSRGIRFEVAQRYGRAFRTDPYWLLMGGSGRRQRLPGARPVDVVELAAAAGGGGDVASEEVTGCVWFRRDWLDSHGLDPAQCAVIGVRGESMEPTLPDGASILVDRSRTALRPGRIYVVRADGALIVKRANVTRDGSRLLVSDHDGWEDAPWPDGAAVVGEVRWVARTLS